MAELKTKPTDASVEAYLGAIVNPQRQADCRAIAQIMKRVTRQAPKMWGAGIVGFGTYHYRYASGHEGDSFLTGFASRKSDITVYLGCGSEEREALFSALGKHRAGKGCLYLKRLSDVDVRVLEKLIRDSVTLLRHRYPG